MLNENRYVPLIDVRPDALLLGAEIAVDAHALHTMRDPGHLEDYTVRRLVHGIEHELIRLIATDPKKAASIVQLQSTEWPVEQRVIGPRSMRSNGGKKYSIKLAIMHPDKLRELEGAGRRVAELEKQVADLGKQLDGSRELALMNAEKASRFDAIQNALRTKLDDADQADF